MTSTVLITGAASGIGLATLRHFAKDGWNVVAGVRSAARAADLDRDLAADGLSARCAIFDLADRGATDAAIAAVVEQGVPDVLVNCAGLAALGPVEAVDDGDIDRVLETNVVAPFRITRALLPHFRRRGSGVIVNVSSGWGFDADAGQGLYAASKHAIEGLSQALHHELRPFGIRVAVIEPGRTATGIEGRTVMPPGFAPGTPYWDVVMGRLARLQDTLWQGDWAEDPAVVAAAIHAAATRDDTPLFTPVGRDTRLTATLRGRDVLPAYDARSDQALRDWAAGHAA